MKTSLLFVLCALVTIGSSAHSRQEELSVVQSLVRMIMSSPEWNDDISLNGTGEEMQVLFHRYEDLFSATFPSNVVGSTWTPDERRLAFENFVDSIPELSTNGMYKAIGTHAVVALGFCREYGATNSLKASMRILSSASSVAQNMALQVFEDLARPTDEMNAYVGGLVTNDVGMTPFARDCLIGSYANVLNRHREDCPVDCFTNGVFLLAGAVTGRDGAMALDQLLLDTYPKYEYSSNRLGIAIRALSDMRVEKPFNIRLVEQYFCPITNRLLKASKSLVELDEFRGRP